MSEPQSAAGELKYRAFISYSHADTPVARTLERRLRRYVLPRALRMVGPGLAHQPRPLKTIFRDEDELVPGAELSAKIRAALARSEYLVVVCSPKAAGSEWVEQEILAFHELRDGAHILPVVVGGEPNAARHGLPEDREALPKALRFQVDLDAAGKAVVSARPAEPLWVDWRKPARGDRAMFLRVVAALLSLASLDELIRRDQRDERRRRIAGWAAGAAGALLVGAVGFEAALKDMRDSLDATRGAAAEGLYAQVVDRGLAAVSRPWSHVSDETYGELVGELRLALAANRLERRFAGPPIEASILRFDGTGRRLLAVSPAGAVGLWDAESGRGGQVADLKGPVCCAAFSPDGGSILIAREHGAPLRLGLDGKRLAQASASCLGAPTSALALDERTWTWAAASPAGACLADARSGRTTAEIPARGGAPAWVLPCSAGRWIGLGRDGGLALMGFDAKPLARRAATATQAVADPDCRRLAAISGTQIDLWDVADPRRPRRIATLAGDFPVRRVAFDRSGKSLLATYVGGDVARLWDASSGQALGEVRSDTHAEIRAAAFTAAGDGVAAPDSTGWVRILRFPDLGSEALRFRDEGANVSDLALSPDGRRLATTAGYDPKVGVTVRLWRLSPPADALQTSAPVRRVAFSHSGRLLAAAGSDGRVRIWDARTLAPLASAWTIQASGPIYSLAFDPRDRRLLTAAKDGSVGLWDLATGRALRLAIPSDQEAVYAAFDPTGARVVAAWRDPVQGAGAWQVFDAATGARLARGVEGPRIWSVAFDPAGRRVLTASQDHDARLWDAATGAPLPRALSGHGDSVNSANFNHKGDRIVTGSDDGTVRLWDAASESPIGAPLDVSRVPQGGPKPKVLNVVFTPDDRRILATTSDGRLIVWDAATRRLIDWRKLPAADGRDQLAYSVAVEPGGRRYAIGLQDGEIRFVDPAEGAAQVVARARQLQAKLARPSPATRSGG